MSAIKRYDIRCDLCDYEIGTSALSAANARREVADAGWTRPRYHPTRNQLRVDACPQCSGEC